jgi:hypothetical protein
VEDASGAGLILLMIAAGFTVLGHWLGNRVGAPMPGAILLGFVGVVLGFLAIYWRFRSL